jgi:hypothetical protein
MMTNNKIGIQLLNPKTLIPYPNNPKKHSEEQVERLSKLIAKYGWTQPIVVDKDMMIIVGHGRRLAALKLGTERVPVVVRDDLSPDEVKALRLGDNRSASTEYDESMVQTELKDLFDQGFEMDLTGYTEKEIEFNTIDLGAFDDTAFVDDVGEAVEAQKVENGKREREIDASESRITDAFGFKTFTVEQTRHVRTFMATVERETGMKGAEAFVQFLTIQGY